MRIDPKVEAPTRKMLEHAIRGELDELSETIQAVGDDQRFRRCIDLCVVIAGYIAVDVLGPEWPTDAGLREMAQAAARSQVPYEMDESKIYDYLKKSAVGFQALDQVFSTGEEMTTWPIVITASLMLTFCPREKELWEYLDDIEGALEAADSVKPSALPAMVLRAHRQEATKA